MDLSRKSAPSRAECNSGGGHAGQESEMRKFARPLATLVAISVFASAAVVAMLAGIRMQTALYRAAASAAACGLLTWISYLVGHGVIEEAINSQDDDKGNKTES